MEEEVRNKLTQLVATRFGNDYQKAFAHYDKDGDGGIDGNELTAVLVDADIGGRFTRGLYASKIMSRLDTNQDGKISIKELFEKQG